MVRRRRKWSAVEAGAGMLGAIVAGKALEAGYKKVKGKEPPRSPGVRGVRWRDALAWSAFAGMAIAVGELLASGAAAAAWKRATGRKPPRKRRFRR